MPKVFSFFFKALSKLILVFYELILPFRDKALYNNSTNFPVDDNGHLWMSKLLFGEGKTGYCPQHYKAKWVRCPEGLQERIFLPTEVYFVEEFKDAFSRKMAEECVLPIAISDSNKKWLKTLENLAKSARIPIIGSDKFKIAINGNEWIYKKLPEERYFLLKMQKGDTLSMARKRTNFFVGKPINQEKKSHNLKLVIPLFVDGLSYEFFRFLEFEKLMPNTCKFFKGGTFFRNCFSTSEWSLPSLASIATGLSTLHHGLFHPNKPTALERQTIGEFFQKNGFLTSQICGNHRKNPSLGYARGFDRTVYKRGMDCTEVTSEFFDSINGFPDHDSFVWLTYFDLHHRQFVLPSVSVQPFLDAGIQGLEPFLQNIDLGKVGKSVARDYDQVAINANIQEIKRLDFYLGLLFDFILSRYANDEFLVCLFADHGQSYLSDENNMLGNARIHTPLMFRGRGVPVAQTDEYVQNTDILPSLLHLSGIPVPETIDGRLPKFFGNEKARDFVFAETVFPGKKYQCIFKGDGFQYFFESEENLSDSPDLTTATINSVDKLCFNRDSNNKYNEEFFRKYLESYFVTSIIGKNSK